MKFNIEDKTVIALNLESGKSLLLNEHTLMALSLYTCYAVNTPNPLRFGFKSFNGNEEFAITFQVGENKFFIADEEEIVGIFTRGELTDLGISIADYSALSTVVSSVLPSPNEWEAPDNDNWVVSFPHKTKCGIIASVISDNSTFEQSDLPVGLAVGDRACWGVIGHQVDPEGDNVNAGYYFNEESKNNRI